MTKPSGRLASRSVAEAAANFGSASAMSMSKQVSMTQGILVLVSLAQLLHPVLRGAWRAATLYRKTNHCPRSEWLIRRRIGFGSLLTFLSLEETNKEAFWEAALNMMMVELESLKRTQVSGDSSAKQAEAEVSEVMKNFNEAKKSMAGLEEEVER